jgi:hypothetical protein
MPSRTERPSGFGRREDGAVPGHRLLSVLDGAQPSGDPGLAGGDSLAVAPAIGPFGQFGAVLFDLADVGFPTVGVRGEGEHSNAGRCAVQDERDRAGFGVMARAVMRGPAVSGQAC